VSLTGLLGNEEGVGCVQRGGEGVRELGGGGFGGIGEGTLNRKQNTC
jgi:hypothetical protein